MKVLLVSDTHRKDQVLNGVIEREQPFDMLIHLGDGEGCEYALEDLLGNRCQLHMVCGNNDFFTQLKVDEEIDIGNYHALLTHGHYYQVYDGMNALISRAKECGANMVLYGHTHRPHCEHRDGILFLNPGSLAYPRQGEKIPTYMILDVKLSGEVEVFLEQISL